ncbi:MAG: preprotein translocase subunit SecG [Acidobacteriota bacterium]|nr:preprotein translocase subunit SecG [Acidobacteriota bacterium]
MQILFYAVLTIHILVSISIVFVILLQQGKSADLAGAFGGQGSQTAFGPRAAANALTRFTTWAAIIFMLTSLTLTVLYMRGTEARSVLDQGNTPASSTPAPANNSK